MRLRGHVDQITRYKVSGWAFDDDAPESGVEVIVSVNDLPICEVVADRYREDLRALGVGSTGNSGFSYTFEPPLPIFEVSLVTVTFKRNNRLLGLGSKSLPSLLREKLTPGIRSSQYRLPTYVIHIGPPKAGSKFIQTSLAALSNELLAEGICYPTDLFSTDRQVWHQSLAARLSSGPSEDLEKMFESLNDGGYKYVALSYEGLFGLSDDSLAYLRSLVGEAEVKIVYYCRRWSERIPSLWKQNVKEGFVETFPEYFGRSVRNPLDAPDLNPRIIWDRFANAFGRDSINLVSFDNLIEHDVDIVQHFVKTFFSWSYVSPPDGVMSNESPDFYDTEILRALNAIYCGRLGRMSDSVRISFLRARDKLNLNLLNDAMKNDLGEIIVNDRAQVFDVVYEKMDAYRDRLVSPEFGNRLFTRAAKVCAYVQQNYLLDVKVVNELHRVFDEINALAPFR
jgi:hypothetical protein